MAEHNYGISGYDEFIRLKNLKLKRFKCRFAIPFELFPPLNRSAPRVYILVRANILPIQVVSYQFKSGRKIAVVNRTFCCRLMRAVADSARMLLC